MNSFSKINKEIIHYNLENLKQLVFEVTDDCNLRCKYCGYSELYEGYDTREGKYMTMSKAKSIIDYLSGIWKQMRPESLKQPIVISFYGGEPLMNMTLIKDIINYIENIGEVGKQFFFSMTTNAMLLDRHMDYLVEKKIQLLISLDGNKQNQSYRVDAAGNNSFDRVIKNIKLLQERYPDYFDKQVNFNSVLHNRNSIESSFRFIKDNFSKGTKISPLNNSGIKKEKLEEFKRTYQSMNESMQQAVNCEMLEAEMFIQAPKTNELITYLHNFSENIFENYNDLFVSEEKRLFFPTGTCSPFSKKMFITVNDKILQCERINHDFYLGMVFDDRVDMDLEQIAKQHNNYVYRYLKQCKKCVIKNNCVQCVFQIDDIHSPESQCLSYRSILKQAKYIDSNLDHLRKYPELYERIMNEVYVS